MVEDIFRHWPSREAINYDLEDAEKYWDELSAGEHAAIFYACLRIIRLYETKHGIKVLREEWQRRV